MISGIDQCRPPKELERASGRMFDITGFVSILPTPTDQRSVVFARYFHVRRVAWTAQLICNLASDRASICTESVDWLAWSHDLNRWPFAHNSEKGDFDQGRDIARFMRSEGLNASDDSLVQLECIIDKRYKDLGTEGRIVLLADIVTGFLEDPLWLLTALNVSPKVIPPSVANHLGLPLGDKGFLRKTFDLLQSFKPGLEPSEFLAGFDEAFASLMEPYLVRNQWASPSIFEDHSFSETRTMIKEDFMRSVVFPYNNLKISHGQEIKDNLAKPLIAILRKENAIDELTRITDAQCLELAVDKGVISKTSRESFRPSLDYMMEMEQESTFSCFMKAQDATAI